MANRSGFMCYHRAADLLCSLPDEACGQLFKALLVYSRDGIVTDFSEHPASAFMSAIFNEQKRFLDEDSARYDAICATKAKAAHDRWKKKALQAHELESTGMHMHADACTSTGMHGGASKIDANDANKQLANIISTRNTPSVARKDKNFSVDSEAYKAASWLAEQLDGRKTSGKPESEETKQRWAADFDKRNRLDGHPWEEVESTLLFCQSDPFWKTNIRSGAKFRAQYDALHDRMEAAHDRTG